MQILSFFKATAAALLFASTAFAADCQNAPGVANGECVKYFRSATCDGSFKIGQYKPTCAGNCFQYDNFQAIHVGGDGTYGTSCTAYKNVDCTDPLESSGNVVVGAGKCMALQQPAKSMKCYYRC